MSGDRETTASPLPKVLHRGAQHQPLATGTMEERSFWVEAHHAKNQNPHRPESSPGTTGSLPGPGSHPVPTPSPQLAQVTYRQTKGCLDKLQLNQP